MDEKEAIAIALRYALEEKKPIRPQVDYVSKQSDPMFLKLFGLEGDVWLISFPLDMEDREDMVSTGTDVNVLVSDKTGKACFFMGL